MTDNHIFNTKVEAIVGKILDVAIENVLDRYFGVRTRWGRVECDGCGNKTGSKEFLSKMLSTGKCRSLQDQLADKILKWIKRSKKTNTETMKIEQQIIERWTSNDAGPGRGVRRGAAKYDMERDVRKVMSVIAADHAKEDFITILHQTNDNLKKRLDTSRA